MVFLQNQLFLRIEALASKAVETRRFASNLGVLGGMLGIMVCLIFFGVRWIFVLASRFLISSSASSVRALQLWFVAMAPKKKTTGPTLTPEYVADAWLCVS